VHLRQALKRQPVKPVCRGLRIKIVKIAFTNRTLALYALRTEHAFQGMPKARFYLWRTIVEFSPSLDVDTGGQLCHSPDSSVTQ
jgi:hypothetical protein